MENKPQTTEQAYVKYICANCKNKYNQDDLCCIRKIMNNTFKCVNYDKEE